MAAEQPGIEFVGPCRDTPKGDFCAFLEGRRNNFDHGNEVRKTPEELAMILDMQEAVVATAARLGVDVRDKLPKVGDYHVYETQEDYEEAARRAYPNMAENLIVDGACAHEVAGILWRRRTDNPYWQMSFTAHETWHRVARERWQFDVSVGDDGIRALTPGMHTGYSPISLGLNEMFTDTATVDSLHTAGQTTYLASYMDLNIIGEELTMKVSRETGVPAGDVHDMLLRGMLTGDLAGLRLVSRVLSPRQMRELLAVGQRGEEQDRIKAAEAIGLPEAARRIAEWESFVRGEIQKPTTYLKDWVNTRREGANDYQGCMRAMHEQIAGLPCDSVGQLGQDIIRIANLLDVSKVNAGEASQAMLMAGLGLEPYSDSRAVVNVGEVLRESADKLRSAVGVLLETQINMVDYMDKIGGT